MKRRALFLILAAGFAACGGNLAEPTGEGYRDLAADEIITGVRYSPTEDGVRKALGVFDTVYVFRDSSTFHLRGVKLEIFGVEGRRAANVTSTSGRLNTATEAMTAIGSVVLITPAGVRIETEELHYDPNTHRIWSDVTTRRIMPDGKEAIADSFTADDQFTKVDFTRLRGDVTGLEMRF